MENILEVKGLCKAYPGFSLQDVTFSLPRGCVMGFVGENGAGKTTTLKSILHLIFADSGEIRVFGLSQGENQLEIRQRIGVVLEEGAFPDGYTAENVNVLMRKTYHSWNETLFWSYIDRFAIVKQKKVKEYSKGMRMKLSIAAALSHGAELLIMDEPTSGLDPVVRDEVLQLFYEFLEEEENRSIILSSHITSDLDKIADIITFIHKGKIVFSQPKDALMEQYGMFRGTEDQIRSLDAWAVKAWKRGELGCEALVERKAIPEGFQTETATIEQMMLLITKGERHE